MNALINIYVIGGAIFVASATFLVGIVAGWCAMTRQLRSVERKADMIAEALNTESRLCSYWKERYHDAELANVLIEESRRGTG